MSFQDWLRAGIAALALASVAVAYVDSPQGTDFFYQGALFNGGVAVDEPCDMEFRLFDEEFVGGQIGATETLLAVVVDAGLFTAALDFGASPFEGAERWLEVSVRRPAGVGGYVTLSPRQRLTAAPYALYALRAPWAGLLGVPAGFADGIDNTGGLVLPFAGVINDPGTAFSITNIGAGRAIDAESGIGGVAIRALAPGNGVALLGLGTVIGSTGAAADDSAGVRGEATNAAGQTFGVLGDTASSGENASGVMGRATAVTGATNGVWGETASGGAGAAGVYAAATAAVGTANTFGVYASNAGDGALCMGVYGVTTNVAPAGNTYGIYGRNESGVATARGTVGLTPSPAAIVAFGVQGQTNTAGPGAAGVYGLGFNAAAVEIYGVRGQTTSTLAAAAGVYAQGNGVAAPGVPNAAALEISNGAITVSGPVRPAGRVCPTAPGWSPIESCSTSFCTAPSPPHHHTIGWFTDIPLVNPLIIDDVGCAVGSSASLIQVSVETEDPPPPWTSWYVQVHSKVPGACTLRVTRMGSVICNCAPPSELFWVNYLIINPAAGGVMAEVDAAIVAPLDAESDK